MKTTTKHYLGNRVISRTVYPENYNINTSNIPAGLKDPAYEDNDMRTCPYCKRHDANCFHCEGTGEISIEHYNLWKKMKLEDEALGTDDGSRGMENNSNN